MIDASKVPPNGNIVPVFEQGVEIVRIYLAHHTGYHNDNWIFTTSEQENRARGVFNCLRVIYDHPTNGDVGHRDWSIQFSKEGVVWARKTQRVVDGFLVISVPRV